MRKIFGKTILSSRRSEVGKTKIGIGKTIFRIGRQFFGIGKIKKLGRQFFALLVLSSRRSGGSSLGFRAGSL